MLSPTLRTDNREDDGAAIGGMLAGAAALALVVGTATAEAKTEVRVTLAYYSDQTEGVFKGMAKDFMRPTLTSTSSSRRSQWDNLQQRLTTDIAGGTAPDLAIIGTRWLVDYVKNDIAEPLDSYMTPDFKARFIETFLPPSTIDGKIYGLPVAASARAMYYNKDVCCRRPASPRRPRPGTSSRPTPRRSRRLAANSYGFALQGKEIETDAYWYYALWTLGRRAAQGRQERHRVGRRRQGPHDVQALPRRGPDRARPDRLQPAGHRAPVQAGQDGDHPERALAARPARQGVARPQLRDRRRSRRARPRPPTASPTA